MFKFNVRECSQERVPRKEMDQNQLGIEAGIEARWSALEWAERLGDLVVAGAVIAATLPLMVLAACAIRFEGPGAILRSEERMAPSGRVFSP